MGNMRNQSKTSCFLTGQGGRRKYLFRYISMYRPKFESSTRGGGEKKLGNRVKYMFNGGKSGKAHGAIKYSMNVVVAMDPPVAKKAMQLTPCMAIADLFRVRVKN